MADIRITAHLKEMEEFLETSNHLKMVLDHFDVYSADKNDLYDLVYDKEKIENWLKEDIENKDVKSDLQSLLDAINLILGSLSNRQLKEIVNNNKVKDVHKLNKAKYGNRIEYKGLKDPKDIKIKQQNIISKYITKNIIAFMTVVLISLLISNGSIFNIANNVAESVIGTVASMDEHIDAITTENDINENQEESSVKSSDLQSVISADKIKPDREKLATDMSAFTNFMSTLISFVATILLCVLTIKIALDLFYIAMPIARMMFDGKTRFISKEAKELVELQNTSFDTEANLVNYTDRIETATALLHNLEDYIDKMVQSEVSINDDEHKKKTIFTIAELNNKIKDIHKRSESSNVMSRLQALSEAEILYRNMNMKGELV